jgi:hypothetical protein
MAKKKVKPKSNNIPTDDETNQARNAMAMAFNSWANKTSPSASTRMDTAIDRYVALSQRQDALYYMAKKSGRK